MTTEVSELLVQLDDDFRKTDWDNTSQMIAHVSEVVDQQMEVNTVSVRNDILEIKFSTKDSSAEHVWKFKPGQGVL